jgi:hypothetical protein
MKKANLIILFFCLVLLSCPMGCRPLAQGKGSLVLGVSSSEVKGKSISPALDLEIAYYDVRGAGPNSAAFSQLGVTGSMVVQNSIVAGAWTITVDAFNSSLEPIGAGSAGVTIEPGLTAQASVQVAPLTGTGSLTIAISWPSGTIAFPAVSGTLTSAGGTSQTITFTMSTDTASYSSGALNAGYYSLILQLSDGAVVEWGSFEAVRILKGQTTTASFDLTSQDLLSGG